MFKISYLFIRNKTEYTVLTRLLLSHGKIGNWWISLNEYYKIEIYTKCYNMYSVYPMYKKNAFSLRFCIQLKTHVVWFAFKNIVFATCFVQSIGTKQINNRNEIKFKNHVQYSNSFYRKI